MFTYKISITSQQILDLYNDRRAIIDNIHYYFYKQVTEPEYYKGYLTEILRVDFNKDCNTTDIIAIIEYRLWKDTEFDTIQERLQVGL